jgi:diaminohydroxyphosphoribosylaminopyrimidine deaminase/5-amino-6-(5-phosphoribosylamino)uracil reductase
MLNFLNYPNSMYLAVIEALKSNTYPNPKVGAVLVDRKNNIKAIGHHRGKGTDHAEIEIIKNASINTEDTLFVTLEPCLHTDTSPSCADELLKTNLKNIVIGDLDTDIRTNGKSIEKLKQAGLNVSVINNVNNFINPNYNNKNLHNRQISYIGKIATSKNNKISNNSINEKYITNSVSLQLTHLIRATVDGILIGKNTLLNDNPLLNVRHESLPEIKIEKYVLWGSDKKAINNVIDKHRDKTFITNFDSVNSNIQNLENLTFKNLENFLISKNITSLLVEGGNFIHKFFMENTSFDYFYKFTSDDNIDNGLSLDPFIDIYLNNELTLNREISLIDNSLHIYN